MNSQSPTAQSGSNITTTLSDRAIAQAFRERFVSTDMTLEVGLALQDMFSDAQRIDSQQPPAGARGAVTDEMVERELVDSGIAYRNAGLLWIGQRGDTEIDQAQITGITAALTGKADGEHRHWGNIPELDEDESQPAATGAGEGADDPHEFGVGIEPNPKARYWQERAAFWREWALQLGYVPESD